MQCPSVPHLGVEQYYPPKKREIFGSQKNKAGIWWISSAKQVVFFLGGGGGKENLSVWCFFKIQCELFQQGQSMGLFPRPSSIKLCYAILISRKSQIGPTSITTTFNMYISYVTLVAWRSYRQGIIISNTNRKHNQNIVYKGNNGIGALYALHPSKKTLHSFSQN